MAELPENLLLPKIERTPSSPHTPTSCNTPADVSPNIKERLNLHVKRRLQQELPQPSEQLQQQQQAHMQLLQQNQRKEKQQKEPAKARRPYQKRADKIKQLAEGGGVDVSSGSAAGAVRKYKRQKVRQHQLSLVGSVGGAGAGGSAIVSGAISDESTVTHFENAGDDDASQDGGALEADMRTGAGRDKDKCPDVLGLVLSMKKRALLQQPEVQEFLQQIMDVIKS